MSFLSVESGFLEVKVLFGVGVHVSSLDVSESVCRGCRVDMATKVMSIFELYDLYGCCGLLYACMTDCSDLVEFGWVWLGLVGFGVQNLSARSLRSEVLRILGWQRWFVVVICCCDVLLSLLLRSMCGMLMCGMLMLMCVP